MPELPFPVVDVHAHFPVANTIGREGPQTDPHPLLAGYARERMARMHREWATEEAEPSARTPAEIDAAADRWAAELDRHGIRWIDFVTGQINDLLASVVRRHPDRFVGLAHHPMRPGAGAEMRRAVDELGLRGYKQLGPMTDFAFEDPALRDLWAFLAERRLPALIHFGFLGRGGGVVAHPRMSPLSLFTVARGFAVRYLHDQLRACYALNLPEADIALVFGGNAARLLGLDLGPRKAAGTKAAGA